MSSKDFQSKVWKSKFTATKFIEDDSNRELLWRSTDGTCEFFMELKKAKETYDVSTTFVKGGIVMYIIVM